MNLISERLRVPVLVALGLVVVVAVLFLMPTLVSKGGQVPPPFVLDHFKCYELRETQPRNAFVFLLDQFGILRQRFERDIVEESELFCNPTRKIHGTSTVGVANADHHLIWYDLEPIRERFNRVIVEVKNQFVPDGARLVVEEPKFLAVPTEKVLVNGQPTNQLPPQGLDHFKCYEVRGERVRKPVRLQDQFDIGPTGTISTFENVVVDKPEFLCNPTNKFHFKGFDAAQNPQWEVAKMEHPDDHLVCYSLRGEKKVERDLLVRNQFGEERLRTREPEVLCVPSTKRVVQVVQQNGVTDDNSEDEND